MKMRSESCALHAAVLLWLGMGSQVVLAQSCDFSAVKLEIDQVIERDPARAVRWCVGHGGRAASAEHVTRRVRSESEQRPGAREVCAVRGVRSEMSLVTSGDPDPLLPCRRGLRAVKAKPSVL